MKFRAELEEIFAVMQSHSIKEIAEYVVSDYPNIDLRLGSIKNYLGKIKREHTEVLVVDTTPDWKVINNNYIFEHMA